PKKLKSLWDLVGTSVTVTVGMGKEQKKLVYNCPLNSPDKQKELLPLLMDKCSTSEKWDLAPRLNINTAPQEFITGLQTIFGLSDTDVANIMEKRPDPTVGGGTDPVFQSTAWLVTEAGLTPKVVKKFE